jgi:septal ring-binding cell division protein DamX
VSVRSATGIVALAAALACAGPYAERPPDTGATGRTSSEGTRAEPPVTDAGSEATVIGRVTPDGRLDADTVAQAPAPEPVERETVVTGYVRGAPGEAATAPRETAPAAPGQVAAASGWRIQVFAAGDEATAAQVAHRVGGAVAPVPVYVEAEGPWFKVRLGDFATRDAAEPLRERLVRLGWTEAWAVRTAIHAP